MRLFLCLFLIFLVSCKKESPSTTSAQTDPRSFQQVWDLYESQVKVKKKNLNFRFNVPASKEEIQILEKVTGQKFPADVINLFSIGNGQAEDGSELFAGFSMISTAEAAKSWQIMENNHKNTKSPVHVEGFAQKDFWNSKWIPIAADQGNNLLCVDFDPAPGGTSGQLVVVYLDDVIRKVIASSVKNYFAKTAAGLRSGQLMFDEFGFGPFTKKEIEEFKKAEE